VIISLRRLRFAIAIATHGQSQRGHLQRVINRNVVNCNV